MAKSVEKLQQSHSRSKVRLSVTLPVDVHTALEETAVRQDVSLAWVLRKAAEQYIDSQAPLFASLSRRSVGKE